MFNNFHKTKNFLFSESAFILTIVAITIFTRLFHLTFQSLWFDELYSMCIADPANSTGVLLSKLETDYHPPLFYLILHGLFQIFPFNDFTARFFVALLGILGVWLIYYLGKEIKNKQTGLMSAFLLSIFYYHIKHSQEVRMYILLFVFVIITSILFLKNIKKANIYYFILYAIFSVLSIYTHYYAFFILLAQGLCLLQLVITQKTDIVVFKKFVYTFLAIFLLYIPWIPNIISTGQRHHFMDLPNIGYFFEYLYNFTGKEPLTTLFYVFGLGLFMSNFFGKKDKITHLQNPGFLLINYSLISVILITFIVSIFKPIINQQSMIAVMPFIVVAVAVGYQKYKFKTIFLLFTALFISNVINFSFINNYYSKNSKENFKQISKMVEMSVPENSNVLAVSQIADFYNYYFRQMNSNIQVINPNAYSPNEILNHVNSFYVINAPFSKEKSRQLEEIDEMGFLILYPQLKEKVKEISATHNNWINYINQNFDIDSIYIDKLRNFEVAFRYKRKDAV